MNPDGSGRKKVGGYDNPTYDLSSKDRCIQLVITVTRVGYKETRSPSAIRCVKS